MMHLFAVMLTFKSVGCESEEKRICYLIECNYYYYYKASGSGKCVNLSVLLETQLLSHLTVNICCML